MSRRAARYSLIVFGLSVVAAIVLLPREALHKGEPISYWVDRACRYGNAKEMDEVKEIGPSAVPHLIKGLRVSRSRREMWLRMRARMPDFLTRYFPDQRSAAEIQYGATITLQRFGPEARTAVPELTRLISDSDYAIDTLAAIGPDAKEALPALKAAALTKQDSSGRARVAWALWQIGRETNTALQICTNLMIAPTEGSLTAMNVVASMGSDPAILAAPFALRILQDTNWPAPVRVNAAGVLGAARMNSDEVRSALLKETTQPEQSQWHGSLRSSSGLALWSLDSQYAPLGTRLALEQIVALNKQSPRKQDFLRWLKSRNLEPMQSLPTLRELMSSESLDLRKAAADAVERIEAKNTP